jgi:hypothetical protein
MSDRRADVVAAWATGAGIGLIALMLTWLVGNRVAGFFWAPPVGATVAFLTAIGVGIATTVALGARLSRRIRAEG